MKRTLTVTAGEKRAVLAIAVEHSADKKLTIDPKGNPISVTHVTQGSCPITCPWMDANVAEMIQGFMDDIHHGGCYGNHGPESWTANRLNRAFTGQSPEEIAMEEAAAISKLSGKYPLRLGIIGEAKTVAAVEIRAAAAALYHAKHNQGIWTYGHALVVNRIPRIHYGIVSVFASCETEAEVEIATELGYAAAMVRPFDTIDSDTRIAGMKPYLCPQQTGRKQDCASCLFCLHADDVAGKAVLIFDPHGNKSAQMREFLARARAAAAEKVA